MSRYRRSNLGGAIYFFTVNLANRQSDLLTQQIDRLRRAYRKANAAQPFETVAICVLPDHLHAIWTLPPDDADFATRWLMIKRNFSIGLPPATSRTPSKIAKREKGIWQRRYWEHLIRDETDLARHVDYVHYNPVKHGLVERVADWPHSSFHRYVNDGILNETWAISMKDVDDDFGERA